MKRNLSILAITAAVLILMLGVYRATRPTSALLSVEEATEQLEELGSRFSAALENKRDVTPLLKPTESIAAQRPEMRNAHQLLGQIYAQLGQTQAAYDAFATALNLNPEDAQLQNLAGTMAMQLGNVTAGETHHRLAVQHAPDNPRLMLPLADLLLKAERWDEARRVLLEALDIELTMHQASAGLSDVYAGRGEPGDEQLAIDQMEKAIAQLPIKPETAATRVIYARKLAKLYADRGEVMEAIQILDSLPTGSRFSPSVLASMASYLEANGQTALAGLQYELALDHDPANADYAVEAARWYLKGGDAAAAETIVSKLETINRRHPALPELRSQIEASR